MNNRIILDPKPAAVTRNEIFPFISGLAVGETITTANCFASVYTGTDPSPQSIVNGPATINGTSVIQSFTDGIEGNIYEVACLITTSLGQSLSLAAYYAIPTILP